MTIVVGILSFIVGGAIAYIVVNSKKESKIVELRIAQQTLQREIELLQSNAAEQEKRDKERLKEQIDAMKLAFVDSAQKIFEQKTKSLSQSNEKDIKSILEPLKEKMEEFKKEVKDSKEKSIATSASLQEQIKGVMEKASSLGQQANNLASALRGSSKIQGNWGETHLEKLLQDYGFQEGVDYTKQELIKDSSNQAVRNEETGHKMIPDFILTFPDNKAVVIDSKVSIVAYLDYCNATNDAEREGALSRHIDSVKRHIKELSKKDYSKGLLKSTKDGLKYVIMYIPNETAFQLFFRDHQDMWRDAFDAGVIVTGDLYLITMLKIIRLTWDENTRRKNNEKIMETASELLDRVGAFVDTFQDIGAKIKKMGDSYESAYTKLFGRQSIASTSKKLNSLGIETKKSIQIPKEFDNR